MGCVVGLSHGVVDIKLKHFQNYFIVLKDLFSFQAAWGMKLSNSSTGFTAADAQDSIALCRFRSPLVVVVVCLFLVVVVCLFLVVVVYFFHI